MRRLLRFNRRLRASVRGLPFKCKSDTIHNRHLLLTGEFRNVPMIAGLLIKYNSCAESPNLVQQTILIFQVS
jgi:hypothetical protein